MTYAHVVSSIAVFMALGGGAAWAATQLSDNSVRSRHIVDGAVKNGDLGAASVSNGKLRDGAVSGRKVARDSLTGADIKESSLSGVQAGNVLAATVRADGSLAARRGAVRSNQSASHYNVVFNRDVTGCVPLVSVNGKG